MHRLSVAGLEAMNGAARGGGESGALRSVVRRWLTRRGRVPHPRALCRSVRWRWSCGMLPLLLTGSISGLCVLREAPTARGVPGWTGQSDRRALLAGSRADGSRWRGQH